MIAKRLLTEYLTEPMAMDKANPLLMWNCDGGIKQTAYQIVTDKWDSGKVLSDRMNTVYPLPVADREQVKWKVRLWDENDVAGEWTESFFEKGITQFDAKWITGNYSPDKKERYPVDCFRKQFFCENTASARLYITACGLYEAKINGEKAGNFCLAPGLTDYNRRIQYQAYDVTDLIKQGENEITVQLADGWYRGSTGAWGLRNQYGTQTKLLAQLEITQSDGTVNKIISDESWDCSNDGPILFADNKDGEIVDADRIPTYSKKPKVTSCALQPVSSLNVYITEHEQFKPVKYISPSGKCVLDFGQNIAGIISFKINAHKGDKLKIRFGELIDSDGEFTQKNIQLQSKKKTTPLQQVIYTCKEGENEYRTTFAIFGFQYAEVESDFEINENDFTAIALYSDMEQTSRFDSSNDLLNRFYKSTLWSAKNNHADIPTDCPTRERHGWSGDAQIFCTTAGYLFNYRSFARKYVQDLVDEQHKDGNIGQIAPKGGVDFYMKSMDGSAGWSDAVILIPWRMYKLYGDVQILENFYPYMKKYADFKKKTVGRWYMTSLPTGIGKKDRKNISNYGQSYGEWAEPRDVNAFKIADFISPHPEETTAYIVYIMDCMSQIATILDKKNERTEYSDTARRVRSGYQALVKTPKFTLDTDRQAKQVRPLYLNLLDEQQTEFAKKRLIKSLDNYGWRLGTGFLSTPFILYVLKDIDIEYAYRLLENEEIPGWLSMPKNGANTIWEAWEGPASNQGGIGSLNHYSKGAVMEWVFSVMCGINVRGENHFDISPMPGGSFTHARMSYNSMYGEVSSAWKKTNDKIVFDITVPSNCTATFTYKDEMIQLGAGTYSITR